MTNSSIEVVFVLLRFPCVISARVTDIDVWQAIVASSTESRKKKAVMNHRWDLPRCTKSTDIWETVSFLTIYSWARLEDDRNRSGSRLSYLLVAAQMRISHCGSCGASWQVYSPFSSNKSLLKYSAMRWVSRLRLSLDSCKDKLCSSYSW